MGTKSEIQWTDATWNIARGCTKVDGDCKYCYMYRQSLNSTRYVADQVIRTKGVFTLPLHYKETMSACRDGNPLIFTSSLTDFFHEDIDSFRHECWDIIRKCPHLTFQILTKRPERIKDHLPSDWGEGWDNVWLGTSVGSNAGIQRIIDLNGVEAKTKFLSLEPLYERLDFSKAVKKFTNGMVYNCMIGIDWIIVGGESGNDHGKYKYRPCKLEWIEEIVNMAIENCIAVFVKQVGTYMAKELNMSERHGGNFDEFPESIKYRQFPS